jgi:hypothetical protein
MDIRAQKVPVGHFSFAAGFVPTSMNLFDEVRKNPEAVCARLINEEQWRLAEWVMDNFVN